MALNIRRIRRIAIAVLDIEAATERYKKLFDIDPFDWGDVPDLKYKWVAFRFGTDGDNQCSMEFLSPMNDPDGTMLIGKFIRKHGEGVYMITLECDEPDNDASEAKMRSMGLESSYERAYFLEGPDFYSWTESYINPKDTFGVLYVLAHIKPKLPRKEGEIPKFPK